MVKAKKNKNLRIVSFDEEIVTKDSAGQLLSTFEGKDNITLNENEKNISKINFNSTSKEVCKNGELKNKKKRKELIETKDPDVTQNNNENQESITEINPKYKKMKLETSEIQRIRNDGSAEKMNLLKEMPNENEKKVKQKKKKSKKLETPETFKQSESVSDEISIEDPKVKTDESIRAQKRKKHAKLLEEKRLKGEMTSQQNALNYLSKWKHCRSEWKFEKLKQIWLQQNLFDSRKIPNEFWETVVEYFSNSKGFIRNVVLRDALKIIEKEESTGEENTDENYLLILKRARDIVQNLQE